MFFEDFNVCALCAGPLGHITKNKNIQTAFCKNGCSSWASYCQDNKDMLTAGYIIYSSNKRMSVHIYPNKTHLYYLNERIVEAHMSYKESIKFANDYIKYLDF